MYSAWMDDEARNRTKGDLALRTLRRLQHQDRDRQLWRLVDFSTRPMASPGSLPPAPPLLTLRRWVRNFVAHDSFGKDGQTFSFHSNAGAVPMPPVRQRR